MSIVRNSAVRTANFLVLHAPPASREWSEALAGQIQFMESDWRALASALMGLRVLLTRPPEPLRTVEELGVAAQRYTALRRDQLNRHWLDKNLVWFGPVLLDSYMIHSTHGVQRLGFILFALFPLSIAFMPGRSLPAREIPAQHDLQRAIMFYRQRLADISTISSWRFWFIPITFTLFFGWGLAMRMSPGLNYFLAGLCLSVVAGFLIQQQRNRKRVAQIDALLNTAKTD